MSHFATEPIFAPASPALMNHCATQDFLQSFTIVVAYEFDLPT